MKSIFFKINSETFYSNQKLLHEFFAWYGSLKVDQVTLHSIIKDKYILDQIITIQSKIYYILYNLTI